MKKLWIGILLASCWQANPLMGQGLFGAPEMILDNSQDSRYPRVLKVDDLDGDGDLDLFGSPWGDPWGDEGLYISENQAGVLTKPLYLPVGYGTTWDATSADLDGDGLPELLYVSATDGLYFRPNLGGMAFGPAQFVSLPATTFRRVAVGDLDADGYPDIIVGGTAGSWPDYDDRIYVVPNLGSGTLGTPFLLDSMVPALEGFLFQDVTADGLPELFLFARYDGHVWWYPNVSGVLQPAQTLIDTLGYTCQILLTDLDNDGNMELVVTSNSGRHVMRVSYAGGGVFGPGEALDLPHLGCDPLIAADLNADGNMDLTAWNHICVLALYNQGGLNFQADTLWTDSRFMRLMAMADFTGNGLPDWADATDALLAWRPNTDSGFGTWQTLSRPGPVNLAFGDIDGDGRMDLVNGNEVLVWQNLEPAGDPPTELISMIGSGKPLILDGDNDGDQDVVSFGDLVLWHENLGASWATPGLVYDVWGNPRSWRDGTPAPEEEYAYSDQPKTEDLDGDGDMDLIFLLGEYDTVSLPSPTGLYERVVALYNDGNGNFSGKRILVDTLHMGIDLATGDINGDNRSDLVVADQYGLFVVLNNGAGAFGLPYRLAPALGYGIDQIALRDMDNDGLTDIIRSNENWGLAWMRNRCGGVFGPAHFLPEPCYYDCDFWPEDWDKDGDTDLLLMHENSLSWYVNHGGAVNPSARQLLYYPDESVYDAFRVDVDGDGLPDLVTQEGGYFDHITYWRKNLRDGCAAPTNLQASLLNDSTVILSWNPVPAAMGYRIRIGAEASSWQKRLASVDHKLEITGLPGGHTLAWSVRATCGMENGGYPPKATFSTPGMRIPDAAADQLWPNPSSGWLMVKGEGPAQLLDPIGRIRWSGQLNGTTRLDLSSLPAGTYWMNWTQGGIPRHEAILLR